MAINYVDYDVVSQSAIAYHNQADNLNNIIETIKKMNADLEQGFQNETSRSFVERISTDHLPKLKMASDAIQEVSDYLNKYLQNKQIEDQQGAAAIKG